MSAAFLPPNVIFLITISRPPAEIRLGALQQRILRLELLGCSDAQITAILGRSEAEIRACRRRTSAQLGRLDRADVEVWAAKQGLYHAGDRLSPSELWVLGGLGP